MSASERLRALDGAMTPGPWQAGDEGDEMYSFSKEMNWDEYGFPLGWAGGNAGIAILRNVLPLIADVVEAAEDPGLADIFDDTTMYPAQKRLAAALTALREHLEGYIAPWPAQ